MPIQVTYFVNGIPTAVDYEESVPTAFTDAFIAQVAHNTSVTAVTKTKKSTH